MARRDSKTRTCISCMPTKPFCSNSQSSLYLHTSVSQCGNPSSSMDVRILHICKEGPHYFSLIGKRQSYGMNTLHLVQSNRFETPSAFQWPFAWHQRLLGRARYLQCQMLTLLNTQQDVLYPHATRLLFVPLKVGTPAGHPHYTANLNFPVLSGDIYRWEF